MYTISSAHEGVVHIEWSCWAWLYKYDEVASPKYLSFQMMLNGQIIAEGGGWRQTWCNPRLVADAPMPGGDVEITIQWRFAGPNSGVDATGQSMMYFGGGQLLVIPRWR